MYRILYLLPACCMVVATPLFHSAAQAATHYDPVKAFSIKSNPAGVWSYHGVGLLPYAHHHYKGIEKLDYWTEQGQNFYQPAMVLKNNTGSLVTMDGGKLVIPTDHLMLNAKDAADSAIVRFQPLSAGDYTLKGDFKDLDSKDGKHVVYILLNGTTELWGYGLGYGRSRSFKVHATLAVGDTLDFGSAPSHNSPQETGLAVTITGP